MKGPLKLSLAIALALSGADVWALGLGAIQIKSGLNQPLDAEIPVIAESPAEMVGLHVGMASAEDFQRVGLNRARVNVPIDFVVATNSRGQTVIKVSTKDIVRDPFVDFLLEVNWAKGKLLREYTVLLDPPLSAPAKTATVAAAPETAPAKSQPLPSKPAPTPKAAPPPKVSAPAEQPKVAMQPKPASAPAPSKPAPTPVAHQAASGEYGPVAEGETLSQIAQSTKPDDTTNVNRMMLALLKANPNAFFKDNINALKRGAILRIPSSDEIKATGSMTDVAAAVRAQNEDWTSGAATSTPTIVAHAGAKDDAKPAPAKSTGAPAAPTKTERLALVPPRAGKGSETTSEHAGASSGSSKDGADSKAELQRTKEALTSREQEVGEMKSRVKQLEDIKDKDQRLITLKDSEIADLQNKLKSLQGKTPSATTPTTPAPVVATATPTPTEIAKPADTTKPSDTTKPADTSKPDAKITAKDIWGDLNGKDGSKSATAMTGPAPSASTPASTSTPSTTTPSTSTSTPASTTTTASPTPPTATVTTPSSTTTTPSNTEGTSPKDASTATTTPSTTTTSDSTTPPTSTTPPIVATAPVKAPTPAKVTPIPLAETPWYQNQMLLLGGGGVLLLIGLFALMSFMRKPKAVIVPVGDADVVEFDAEGAAAASEEEHRLLDELGADPQNTSVSLELLRFYYAHGDVSKFEATAEAMHANVLDLSGSEWQEAMAMGTVLAPHNPLFSGDAGGTFDHELRDHDATLFGTTHHDEHLHTGLRDDMDRITKPTDAVPDDFDFDLPEQHVATPVAPVHDDMSFDLPPPTPAPVVAVTKVAVAAPAVAKAEEFFVGEDAIGTKLDLAKAYLDMGDPEGARSMLDEVLAEGNESQKGEARKLLADIK
jgi:pilus assembly protein FimV